MYMRCSKGHVFPSNVGKNLFALHLGPRKYQMCPVCHSFRITARVRPQDLTDEQVRRLEGGGTA
ncbi:hypothetical protein GCM10010129_24520 [Streptomyces fumigatiscleroticus]|nr:hypothetical protein GCM10010129_24520 [Streptomyces fumigatiscleroticus]